MKNSGDARIATTVTGTGTRHRRRGEVVNFQYTCLLDDSGAAVSFKSSDLLPERGEALPPAMVVRGNASYQPKLRLPQGAELRVQLIDAAASGSADGILSEVVVRSSWEEPIPFVLRLPLDTKLDGRKLLVAARVVLGATTLYRIKQDRPITPAELHGPVALVLEAVVPNSP